MFEWSCVASLPRAVRESTGDSAKAAAAGARCSVVPVQPEGCIGMQTGTRRNQTLAVNDTHLPQAEAAHHGLRREVVHLGKETTGRYEKKAAAHSNAACPISVA